MLKDQYVFAETIVDLPIEKTWELWTDPDHIMNWYHAYEDWECPSAENDVTAGAAFRFTLQSKDKKQSYDYVGSYEKVDEPKYMSYKTEDGKRVELYLNEIGHATRVREYFETDESTPKDILKSARQSLLDNFKDYAEDLNQVIVS